MNQQPTDNTSLPLQASNPNKFKIIAIFIALILICGVNFYLFSGSKKATPNNENDEQYHAPVLRTDAGVQSSSINKIDLDKQLKLKEELATAKAKAFIERLQAPQQPEEAKSNQGSVETKLSKQTDPVRLNDPNSAFLAQASNSKAEHVYATHYGSLPYMVSQGKFIFANLATAINSDLPGQISAIVSEDVYGDQGRKILIPKGSQLIGEYRSGLVNNQSRLFVVWTRVKEPNGIDVQLGSPGTDALGQAGLTGYVDNHYAARYLSATLIALIGAGAANAGVASSDQFNSAAAYRQNVSQALATEASNTLSQNINIPPTIHVPQGQNIVVYVNRDLDFSRVYK